MGKSLANAETDDSIKPKKGPACGVAAAHQRLSADDREVLETWLDDSDRQHAWISRALRSHADLHVSAGTISRHRVGDCACGR